MFGGLFLGALVGRAFAGCAAFKSDQVASRLGQVTFGQYLTSASFAVDVDENWQSEFRTRQNWQSDFLAVGSMAVLSVYLRQRGSPESRPVGSAHTSTRVEG